MQSRNVPEFAEDALVGALLRDLKNQDYVSAAANSRNILNVSKVSNLHKKTVLIARKACEFLEALGYSQKTYFAEVLTLAEQCPENAVPRKQDGTCPEGYYPMLANMADKNTRKCCAKMFDEIGAMDKNVNKFFKDIEDAETQQAFERRFMIRDKNMMQQRDAMIGIPITPKIATFQKAFQKTEVERIIQNVSDVDSGKVAPTEVFGSSMTKKLYDYMRKKFNSVKDFAEWFVNNDWTFWWVMIYVFRLVALFVCMYVQVANAGQGIWDWMYKVADQWFGIKPATTAARVILLKSVLPSLIGSSLLAVASSGMISIGAGLLNGVLGTASLVRRLVSMFSLPGFVIDLMYLVSDIIQYGLVTGYEAMKLSIESGTVNPMTIVMNGLDASTAAYCNATMRSFFALVSSMVGDMTIHLFVLICNFFTKFGSPIVGTTVGPVLCNQMKDLLKHAMDYAGGFVPKEGSETGWYVLDQGRVGMSVMDTLSPAPKIKIYTFVDDDYDDDDF